MAMDNKVNVIQQESEVVWGKRVKVEDKIWDRGGDRRGLCLQDRFWDNIQVSTISTDFPYIQTVPPFDDLSLAWVSCLKMNVNEIACTDNLVFEAEPIRA